MSQHLKHFTENDIDTFREAFFLFAKNRTENPIYIRSVDELCVIMRSLGLSPTIREIGAYMKKYSNKMSFSDFLEVVHTHSRGEYSRLLMRRRCQLFITKYFIHNSLHPICFSREAARRNHRRIRVIRHQKDWEDKCADPALDSRQLGRKVN